MPSPDELSNFRVSSTLSGALVLLEKLPLKMNPIIRPLMDTVKFEENEQLQVNTNDNVAILLSLFSDIC